MPLKNFHILYLTRWYPHKTDPQLGIFIRKHAIAASHFCRVSVLNVRPDLNASEKLRIEMNKQGNFSETVVYFTPASNRFSNYLRYVNAHYSGYESIVQSFGKPQLMQLNVMYGLSLITLLLHYKKHIPYLIAEHWHGFVDHKFSNKNRLFKKLLRYTASKAKAIITVSEFLKNGMIANGLRCEYFVVPNVVESITMVKNNPSKNITMLTVADLDDDIKNISAVLRVFSGLINEGLGAVKYHIIGSGKDEKKLKQLAIDLGLTSDHIIFHGLQSNDFVMQFLNETDFVVINSRYETFSVIAAEALLCGKPLICTRCGGVNDFVDNECGYLINPGNNAELKTAISSMIVNYKIFESEKLKQKLNDRFSSYNVGKQLFDIYKKIAENNQA